MTAGTITMITKLVMFLGARGLFEFIVPYPHDMVIVLCVGVASATWFEVCKLITRYQESA